MPDIWLMPDIWFWLFGVVVNMNIKHKGAIRGCAMPIVAENQSSLAKANSRPKRFVVASGKGGSGKTTTARNLAVAAVQAWFRICPFWVTQVAWKPPACDGRILDTRLFVAGGG